MPQDNTILDMNSQDFLDDMQKADGIFLDMVAALATCLIFSFCVVLFILTLADSASGPVAQSAASASSVRSMYPPYAVQPQPPGPRARQSSKAGLEVGVVGVEQ